ncbi:MAG: hypothetical protein WD335_03220 [Candidatus Paceibacterota bacterium]
MTKSISIFSIIFFMIIMMGCDSTEVPTAPDADTYDLAEVTENQNSTVKSNFKDEDDNGIPDEGEVVTGKYTALYAYDAAGDWYLDLGDGREQGTVNSVDELDQSTLTVCDYQVQYRGSFENDPFLDSGWIINDIKCSGYDNNGTYNYVIVHETDPRYTGNSDWAIWNTWEFHTYTVSGQGNLVRPENYVGN